MCMNTVSTVGSYDLPQEHQVVEILRAYGVRRAQLSGSAARGELTDESDIDLLIEFPPDVLLNLGLGFIRLKNELEAATGHEVDLMTNIKPAFRPYIEDDLVELPL